MSFFEKEGLHRIFRMYIKKAWMHMAYRLKIETKNFEKTKIPEKLVSARYTESVPAGPPRAQLSAV